MNLSPSTVDCFKCGNRIPWVTRNTYHHKVKGWAHRICPRRRLKRGERKRRKIVRYRYGKPDLARTDLLRLNGSMTDPRSYVTLDNREILYGEDWERRKDECFADSEGRCEFYQDEPCFELGIDVDHIIKRSKQRDDKLSNLRSLCRMHHNLRHKEFRTQFKGKETQP